MGIEGAVKAPLLLAYCPATDAVSRDALALCCTEVLGVECQMRLDKCRDEVIAVVVASLHAYFDWVSRGFAGLLNKVRLELLFQKVIRRPLVDEYRPLLLGLG